jgi:hypothetical protein
MATLRRKMVKTSRASKGKAYQAHVTYEYPTYLR